MMSKASMLNRGPGSCRLFLRACSRGREYHPEIFLPSERYWDSAMTELESIVRAIAAAEPPLDRELGDCLLCQSSKGDNWRPEDHEPDCPWRQAMEWTARHPE